MKQPVILKMFPNGISIHMDPTLPFEALVTEVKEKFLEAEGFFKDAKMALSFEGRDLDEAEERELIKTIVSVSSIKIICIIGKDNDKNKLYVKALKQAVSLENKDDATIYRGCLKNGDIVESKKNVIIVGDVYPGCAVSSAKDVVILGGLYGEAYAGVSMPDVESDEKLHYIVTLDLAPEQMKIGNIRYIPEKKGKWLMKPKWNAKISYVEEDAIVTESITKDFLSKLL